MGCEFNFYKLKAKNKKDAIAEVYDIIEDCAYDFGHNGYTGSFAEVPGVDVKNIEFEDIETAYNWLEENTQKWEDAFIVSTADGTLCVGAHCSS